MKFGVVAIGRNEGQRLKLCLASVAKADAVIYVDSGSTDDLVKWAREQGVDAVVLDISIPFNAGRARNEGFKRLRARNPELPYVQFVDGDCELRETWFSRAVSFLDAHRDVAVVSGRLRERYPDRSIYNWLCDREWDGPSGEVRSCGGIALMRADAFESVAGFRNDLIAGEEPELCVRLRAAGWRIWRLDAEMGWHDAAMMRLQQWWRRAVRAGYAFAGGAELHGAPPERFWVWESRRAWIWGFWLPLVGVVATVLLFPWGAITLLLYPLQFLRQVIRNSGRLRDRALLSFFQLLARFAEVMGQIRYYADRVSGARPRLIEYK